MEDQLLALFEDENGSHTLVFGFVCPGCTMPVWDEMDVDGNTGKGAVWKGFPLSFALQVGRVELFLFHPPTVFVTAGDANNIRRFLLARSN